MAQTVDWGTEFSARGSFRLNRHWQLDAKQKIRLTEHSSTLAKSETAVGLQRAILRSYLGSYGWRLKLGGSYHFIWRLNNNHYYEPQHRLNLSLGASKAWGHWKFSSRTRWQTTFRDEQRSNPRLNPKMYLRERLQISYAFPDRPWAFYANEEFFYRLNDPTAHIVDQLRTSVGAVWQIDRQSSFELFVKSSCEIQVANPERLFILGVSYNFN